LYPALAKRMVAEIYILHKSYLVNKICLVFLYKNIISFL